MRQSGDLAKYGTAVGHRGLSSCSNLLITVMAGRQLETSDFGLFALMMAATGFALILHAGLFSEPMMVYGPQEYVRARRFYLIMLAKWQLTFGLGCALFVLFIYSIVGGDIAYIVLALILPLAFSMDVQERSFFMQLRPLDPCVAAGLQFATLCIVFWGLNGLGLEGLAGFLFIHAMGLGVANVFLLYRHMKICQNLGTDTLNRSEAIHRHMRFAAFSISSHLLLFLVTNFYIFVLPVLHDLVTTAHFRAQSAVTGVGVQAFSALGMMAVPLLRVSTNQEVFLKRLRLLLLLITMMGFLILLGAGLFGKQLIDFIYEGKYELLPLAYWLAGLFPITIGYAYVLSSALRAMDRADLVTWASGLSVALGLPPGVWLTMAHGAEGAIFAQILGAAIMSVSTATALRRTLKKPFKKFKPDGEG